MCKIALFSILPQRSHFSRDVCKDLYRSDSLRCNLIPECQVWLPTLLKAINTMQWMHLYLSSVR